MKSMLRAWICLVLLSPIVAGCSDLCEEIEAGKHDKILDQLREQCDCDFTIECAELEEGITGVTIRGPNGQPLIQLSEEAEEDTLRHELFHAVDLCQRYSDIQAASRIVGVYLRTRHPNVLDLTNIDLRLLQNLSTYMRLILAELIAYRKFPTEETEEILEDPEDLEDFLGFPNGDSDDLFIRDGVNTAERFRTSLPQNEQKALKDLLTDLGLVPSEMKPSNPEYPPLKKLLIELADDFATTNQECCELIESLVKDL